MPSSPQGGKVVSLVVATLVDQRAALGEQTRRFFFSADHRPLVRAARILAVLAVAAGVVMRFYAPTDLWLDESQNVAISASSLSGVLHGLIQDGSPPLFYYLLHFWMMAFGHNDVAVRALPGLESVAALPFFWFAGRRVGGTRTAWAVLLLVAVNPFAAYYATDTRMYSQVMLLGVLAFLAMMRALESPTRGRLAALAAVIAGLLYTHYWATYLVASTVVWLVWHIRQSDPAKAPAVIAGVGGTPTSAEVGHRTFRAVLGAVFAGCALWLPCTPLFIEQTLHTGTPWSGSPGAANALSMFAIFQGHGPWGLFLSILTGLLLIFGLFGRPVSLRREREVETTGASAGLDTPADLEAAGGLDSSALDGRLSDTRAADSVGGAERTASIGGIDLESDGRLQVVLDLRLRPAARPLLVLIAGTIGIAIIGGVVASAAFSARYTSIVFPLFMLTAALGFTVFADRRVAHGLMAVACVAGLLTGFGNNHQPRTQGTAVAAVLNAEAQPGDEVVYCPDQLGPAVNRVLKVGGLEQFTFPRAVGPARVNWYNYKQTIKNTNPSTFAQEMVAHLPSGHTLWLVGRNGYPGFSGDCGALQSWFNFRLSPGETVVTANQKKYYEYENLVRYSS